MAKLAKLMLVGAALGLASASLFEASEGKFQYALYEAVLALSCVISYLCLALGDFFDLLYAAQSRENHRDGLILWDEEELRNHYRKAPHFWREEDIDELVDDERERS